MKIKEKRSLGREEVAAILRRMAEEIATKGTTNFGGQSITLPEILELEIEYKEKPEKHKLEMEFVWRKPGAEAAETPPRTKIADRTGLPPGQGTTFSYGNREALLVHLQSGEFRAFVALCPHKGKPLHWDETAQKIVCPAHGASFDGDTGNPLQGPVHTSLEAVPLEIDGDDLYAGT